MPHLNEPLAQDNSNPRTPILKKRNIKIVIFTLLRFWTQFSEQNLGLQCIRYSSAKISITSRLTFFNLISALGAPCCRYPTQPNPCLRSNWAKSPLLAHILPIWPWTTSSLDSCLFLHEQQSSRRNTHPDPLPTELFFGQNFATDWYVSMRLCSSLNLGPWRYQDDWLPRFPLGHDRVPTLCPAAC